MTDEITTEANSSRGNFFAIDQRIWPTICRLGINAMVTYLILARGTARDNRTTLWSINAVEVYTSISRGRARLALRKLLDANIVRQTLPGSRPRYELPDADELYPGWSTHTQDGASIFAKCKEFHKAAQSRNLAEGHLIWLPNELVTGATNESPPIERVRQSQNRLALSLLVDLYFAQDPVENGGIHHHVIRENFKRTKLAEVAEFDIWVFESTGLLAYSTIPFLQHLGGDEDGEEEHRNLWKETWRKIWIAIGILRNLGLIEFVPHLFESDTEDAEIIHPYGIGGSDHIEGQLGQMARDAALALLPKEYLERADEFGKFLAPVPRHFAYVQMIGVARLRYRPKTRRTAAWWADHNDKCARYLESYQQLLVVQEAARLQHQG